MQLQDFDFIRFTDFPDIVFKFNIRVAILKVGIKRIIGIQAVSNMPYFFVVYYLI